MVYMNIHWEEGRAASAPTLDGFSLRDRACEASAARSTSRPRSCRSTDWVGRLKLRGNQARSAEPRCRGHCGVGHELLALGRTGTTERWRAPV
eukprot:9570608-Prorocentrum_lima.AAC.1